MLLGERDRRPDFMLIDPSRGILIVEVKDWGVDNITRATEQQFFVHYRGTRAPKPNMNPALKCQIYLLEAREQLVAMPTLRDEVDKLQVPIDYFVAFPNISRKEFNETGFDKIIVAEHVLLSEDLVTDGRAFVRRYNQVLPELKSALTDQQRVAITRALLPDMSIPIINTPEGLIPAERKVVLTDVQTVSTYNLSLEQELIAKSLGEGPRLLRGLAGAGKTLIMLYRAKMLAANNKTMRILVLCWNVSLGNYMRQIYDNLQIEAEGQVTIQHFSEFIRDLVKDRKGHDLDVDDPWFIKQLDTLDIKESEKYDAIYIDEAQDFREEWIAFLYHRLLEGEPKSRNLLIAADGAQRIYQQRGFSWSNLGIPMVGRSKILKKVFRNSARVWIFSALLLLGKDDPGSHKDDPSRVEFSSKGGRDPALIECKNLEAQIEKAVEIVKGVIKNGYAVRNVLILYKQKTVEGFHLVEHLRRQLDKERIPNDWIAEDRAKSTFDWDADTVKISTVHSAKGMDSPVVIVLGAEMFQPPMANRQFDEMKLMYVALTRAREYLVILYTGNGGLIPQLRHCQQEYREYHKIIIEEEMITG